MNWNHVMLSALVGVVLAVVASTLYKKGKVNKLAAVAIFVVGIVLWNIADIAWLKSGNTSPEQGFDEAFNSMPLYKLIKENDPAFYARMRGQALEMAKQGKTQQDIIDTMQANMAELEMQRIQFAPDDDVVAYMRVNMKQTREMQQHSDDACFRFLMPQVKGGVNPIQMLSKEVIAERMDVEMKLLSASYGPNTHKVTPEEQKLAEETLAPIGQSLAAKYGDTIEVFTDPQKGVGQEKQVCNMVQELWHNVLALPPEKAGPAIRVSMQQ
ncbi:hypothetical protein SMY46_000338 [Cronobacter turicensis]|uniref:hypothetical protein n=1 Tax=Cronobacter turicensis TaxID=413502 RepID=UPI0011ABB119|nr:hypothetical protein [Cronobacter turicensis]EKY3120546.1 hypothetical protein [Cronobacter turicensis]ELU8453548.1 hypothetical protein [Cronobacter turicensis]ELY4108716.1 hypothetical protein [Cronobacter turicensis]ELY4217143.1 hypothetical protein [Cronobacter turicensis]EMA1790695.1 hypothetical protein [Cronobacter turicensis]